MMPKKLTINMGKRRRKKKSLFFTNSKPTHIESNPSIHWILEKVIATQIHIRRVIDH